MSNVFISYKSDEFDEANWVKRRLEAEGISCWMAPMSIHGGLSYAEEIPKAIRECCVFVLILSDKVRESKWIPRELDQAINNNKTILPFMIVDCALKDDFEFYLSNVQRYEAYKDKEEALLCLIRDIKNILHTDVEPNVEDNVVIKDDEVEETPDKLEQKVDENSRSAKKRKKKHKNQKDKSVKKTDGKKRKKPLVILACIALSLVIVFSSVFIYNANNTVWICSESFKKSDSFLQFENVSVTNEDIVNMAELDEVSTLIFKKCHLKGIDLNRILMLVTYSVTFDGCSLNNADIANLNVKNSEINKIILDNNPELSDLSVLRAYAGSVTRLSFNNCSVSDLNFIKDFKNLTSLSAVKNNISDITALENCVSIVELDLSENNISTLEPISGLVNITSLDVYNNKLVNLMPLEKMIHLTEINASNNALTDISGLTNATLLETVNFSNNQISDVSVLAKSSLNLNSVNISNNKVSDISSLAVCNLVTKFFADNNAITDVSALKNWGELSSIDISHNQIADVSALSACHKLSHIDLSNNVITSVDCFDFSEHHATGIYFNISNNVITSVKLSPFDCSDMILYGNKIEDVSFLNGFEYIANLVFDYNEKIDFESLKNTNSMTYYVLNCPLDKQVYVSTTLGAYSVKFELDDFQ